MTARQAVVALVMLLPHSTVKLVLLRRLGWRVHPTARVGPSLALRVDEVDLEAWSRLGPCNVLRDLRRLHLAERARFGRWNWVSGARELRTGSHDLEAALELGPHSAVTGRHYLDVSGGVVVGPFATLAGVRSTVVTHGIDLGANRQSTAPVTVGRYSVVSSSCKLVPGSHVPDFSVVAMGAVVVPGLTRTHTLYTGVPARPRKPLAPDSGYFHRSQGPVALPPTVQPPGTGLGEPHAH